mmetsp:Transcript_12004/g.29781  ORF Transcript_12004/g.29781 Transcript_12004/m.29781 type:complete len:416 (-) Transcript_12004:77-1324(-)
MTSNEPYPVLRMVFQVAFLMVLGTIYAYSTWSNQFRGSLLDPGPFPTWTADDLGFVYSMGIFGAFLTPIGGVIYDRTSPTTTYLVGLCMALTGFAGMIGVIQAGVLTDLQARYVIGFLYYLEEQGSSTLYMGIALDTLVHFPAKNVSLSMGLVALGYSLSSVLFSFVIDQWQMSVVNLFVLVGALMSAFTVARVCILGDVASSEWQQVSTVDEDKEASLSDALRTPAFRSLFIASFLGLSVGTSLLGFVEPLGDASGLSGAALAQGTLLANCFGRVVVGLAYDVWFRYIPSQRVFFALIGSMAIAYFFLILYTFTGGSFLLWLGCLAAVFLYGSSPPVIAAFIKDYFSAGLNGTVLGLHHLSIALGNFVFMWALGPTQTRTSEGFLRPLRGAFICSMFTCCLTFFDLLVWFRKAR